MPIASEHKLDVVFVVTDRAHRFHAGFGMGARRLVIAGTPDRPASTIHGIDLIRLDGAKQIVRVGNVALDFYFGWTFGLYDGEVTMERVGDMAYPTRDVFVVTTAYVLGLQTTLAW